MPYDKKLHIYAGFIISLIGACLWGAPLGFGLACLAGLLKEARDKITGKGTVEGLDWLATMAGGSIPIIILEVMKQL